ncbi:globin domain-containing protein [Kutzneria sp. CA-103260]|uniref:globin domain-containing protein n=1 Tax=Kutzneria sp. CA-103260 TaxID=2802641 RepID=UPI001BA44C04|nr:globin domain-containing protein [Kutzneria sp. CA-103260]QUQ66279.1 flavohemoprotein [Kutzneria sp. CA-103260]
MLSSSSATIVAATLPAVRAAAVDISTTFYASMFAEHPALLDLFNRGNQANGDQQRALAGAVIAYAHSLIGGTDVDQVVRRIAHKHASLSIRPEQYTIVSRHLMAAVAQVLGPAVTPAVETAWDEVFWLFAVRLIAAETRLYQQQGVDPAQPHEPWRVVGKHIEAHDAVSLLLAPESGRVPEHRPGQYVSVAVDLPGAGRQARQYTISHATGHSALRVTVRPVRGTPDGLVSCHIADRLDAGDTVAVSRPFGDLTLDEDMTPVLLVSAGIGITPMAAMIEHIAEQQPLRSVVAVHAEREPGRHALLGHMLRYGARLHCFEHIRYYEYEAGPTARPGRVRPDEIPLPAGASAYLCGPLPFMRDVRASLLRRGMPAERINFEVFGADLWSTDADLLPSGDQTPVG